MSFDMSQPDKSTFYVNFRTVAPLTDVNAVPDRTANVNQFAIADQEFSFSNLLENASKYLVSVERFRVPIQTIPMYPQENGTMLLTGAAPFPIFNAEDSFSLLNFINQVNDSDLAPFLTLTITNDGRLRLNMTNVQQFTTLTMSNRFAQMFGIPGNIINPQNVIITGSAPVFDRFDQLSKINIVARAGLSNIQQEVVTTNIFRNLVTDFLVPSSSTITWTTRENGEPDADFSITDTVRQDIEFNSASDRRFINMRGNAPIQNIQLEVEAVLRDGSQNRIVLPPNGILEIKLAFWRREQ